VLMQYLGYPRRSPDDPPNNKGAFGSRLAKVNQLGDFRRARMIKAFRSSTDYRNRVGP